MTEFIQSIEKIFSTTIKNKSIFVQAFTHKSYDINSNNENLEFLGDRVLGLVLSKKLYDLYPDVDEGSLDKRFANLVNRKTCASIFWSLNINKFILLGDSYKKLKKNDEKILSDMCESLIGALYIEKGYYFVEKKIHQLWNSELKNSGVTVIDPKSQLQEYSLKKYNILPLYKNISQSGPKHKPIFKISVKVKNFKHFTGTGKSKKIAQQSAAKKLLSHIKIDQT